MGKVYYNLVDSYPEQANTFQWVRLQQTSTGKLSKPITNNNIYINIGMLSIHVVCNLLTCILSKRRTVYLNITQ